MPLHTRRVCSTLKVLGAPPRLPKVRWIDAKGTCSETRVEETEKEGRQTPVAGSSCVRLHRCRGSPEEAKAGGRRGRVDGPAPGTATEGLSYRPPRDLWWSQSFPAWSHRPVSALIKDLQPVIPILRPRCLSGPPLTPQALLPNRHFLHPQPPSDPLTALQRPPAPVQAQAGELPRRSTTGHAPGPC